MKLEKSVGSIVSLASFRIGLYKRWQRLEPHEAFSQGRLGHLHAPPSLIFELSYGLPFQSLGPVTVRSLLPKPRQPSNNLGCVAHVRGVVHRQDTSSRVRDFTCWLRYFRVFVLACFLSDAFYICMVSSRLANTRVSGCSRGPSSSPTPFR